MHSVKETASRWKISERRVSILSSEGRIEGVVFHLDIFRVAKH